MCASSAAGFHHEHSTVDEPRYRHVERDGAHLNVGVVDMMRKADLMGGNSQRYLELFVDAAIIYGILIIIVSLFGPIA